MSDTAEVPTWITDGIDRVRADRTRALGLVVPVDYPTLYAYRYLRQHARRFGLPDTAVGVDGVTRWLRRELGVTNNDPTYQVTLEALADDCIAQERLVWPPVTEEAKPGNGTTLQIGLRADQVDWRTSCWVPVLSALDGDSEPIEPPENTRAVIFCNDGGHFNATIAYAAPVLERRWPQDDLPAGHALSVDTTSDDEHLGRVVHWPAPADSWVATADTPPPRRGIQVAAGHQPTSWAPGQTAVLLTHMSAPT